MKFYLYKITNKVNLKSYIGITAYPERRWKEHQSPGSCCRLMKRAIEKYGADNFEYKILCVGNEQYIKDLEVAAILEFKTLADNGGYNLHLGSPKDGSLMLAQENRNQISKGLKQHYENNVCKNKGRKITVRSDDTPVYFDGFWFPNSRVCISSLKLSKSTFYRRLRKFKEGLKNMKIENIEPSVTQSDR